jgi:hypothetical protein
VSLFSKIFGRDDNAPPTDTRDPIGDSEWLPFIAAPHGEEPVVLRNLAVRARVSGLFAETTQTLTFYNPNGRDLEGSLSFPLPDGAVVCGYALDVDGRMVDGVVVPKQEARRILEAEERKGVDPGLIEQVQGNVYRTRVYPIPAFGTRTLRIVYVTELTVAGVTDVTDVGAAYHLPLRHAGHIDEVALRIEVLQAPVEPVISGGVGNLSMRRWDDGWLAEARLGKGVASEDLQVKLPDLPDSFTVVEAFAGAEHDAGVDAEGKGTSESRSVSDRDGAGEVFFCISQALPEPRAEVEPWSPTRVAIAWDGSGSHGECDRDLGLVRELCAAWGDVELDVLVFRDQPDVDHESFAVRDGDADELCDYLRELPYDGGTDLSALDLSRTPHPDAEAWLLFSDGMGTVATGVPELGAVRVYTITSSVHNNSDLLTHIARETGAAYVNLVRTRVPAAREEIVGARDVPWHVANVAGCRDVHTRRGHGRLMILGRMDGAVASVELAGEGAPGYHVRTDDARAGRIVARAWAGMQVALVKITESDDAGDALVALGREYGLVTPGTSLLVLERLEQYLEYDIEPPATLPDMRAEFHRRRDSERSAEDRRKHKHIDTVLGMWRSRVAWWETDFRPAWSRRRAEENKRDAGRSSRGRGRRRSDMAPPVPGGAPPAPARPMAAAPPPPAPPAPGVAEPMMRSISQAAPSPVADMRMESAASLSFSADMDMDMDMEPGASDEMFEGGDLLPADSEELAKEAEARPSGARGSIKIQAWTPDTPYLGAMKRAGADAYTAYLDARAEYSASPAFYLDCGDYLLGAGERELGLRVLSNLLELGLDDAALMRMYAWRLQQAGELDLAVSVFERVLRDREDEPQSHRDLALALGERWRRDGDPADAVRAMALLYEVVVRAWERFPEIELIALMELNRLVYLVRKAGDTGGEGGGRVEVPGDIDKRLLRNLPLDVRISMSWDADLTDVDLHVFEPGGEHAYYGHNRTTMGGLVSRDFRDGYGPEEYVLRRAMPGTYTIKAHYYGSSQQSVTGPCTVIVHVFTNYGRPEEREQVLTLRLDRPRDQVLVGEITIDSTGEDPEETAYSNTGHPEMPDWRARFTALHMGMTVTEITAAVGQPTEIRGDDGMILVYRPGSGVEVQVHAGPRLTAVKLVTDGAEIDLV